MARPPHTLKIQRPTPRPSLGKSRQRFPDENAKLVQFRFLALVTTHNDPQQRLAAPDIEASQANAFGPEGFVAHARHALDSVRLVFAGLFALDLGGFPQSVRELRYPRALRHLD